MGSERTFGTAPHATVARRSRARDRHGGYETTITWAGTTYTSSPTPVLGPGCGELRVIVDCCYVPNYVTVTLTKE